MYNRLYKQLSNLNIQNNSVSKTTIQLIMHYSNLSSQGVFIDLCKAFDTDDLNVLLRKFTAYLARVFSGFKTTYATGNNIFRFMAGEKQTTKL